MHASNLFDYLTTNALINLIFLTNFKLCYQLQQLLDKTKKLAVDKRVDFSPNCALFVCNKWDSISPSEEAKVMEHITFKLSHCWPNIDPGSQIIRLSTTKALNIQQYGIMNEEFALLTDKIALLIKKSIETRLEQHWR